MGAVYIVQVDRVRDYVRAACAGVSVKSPLPGCEAPARDDELAAVRKAARRVGLMDDWQIDGAAWHVMGRCCSAKGGGCSYVLAKLKPISAGDMWQRLWI